MSLVGWMVAGSAVSWLAAAMLLGAPIETLLGMIGPLAIACASWIAIERAHRQDPQRVTALMIRAFAGKMVFFAAYVALVVGGLPLRPVPFVVSFAGYFIALHFVEALALRRLFAGGMRASG